MPHIRRVSSMTEDQVLRAARMLYIAFKEDALTKWFLCDSEQYSVDFWVTRVRLTMRDGDCWMIGEFEAFALWFPPGIAPDMSPRGQQYSGWDKLMADARDIEGGLPISRWNEFDNACSVFNETAASLPPAHYLNIIAVSPDHQRKGYGSALIKHHLAISDACGEDTFLETGTDYDVRFYTKLGFSVAAKIQLDESIGVNAHQMRRSAPNNSAAIRRLTAASDETIDRLAAMMADAFDVDDLVGGFIWQHNKELGAAWFDTRIRQAMLQGGEVWVSGDGDGIALWWPPGKSYDMSPEGMDVVHWSRVLELSKRVNDDEPMRAYAQLRNAFDQWADDNEGSWRLNILAVAPHAQRKGIGSALVRHHLAISDACSEATYLETESEVDLAFYRRFGYEVKASAGMKKPGGDTLVIKQMRRSVPS